MAKRVFLIVLDSVGIGELPDAANYGDCGCNTLKACFNTGNLHLPNLKKLGLFNIEGNEYGGKTDTPEAKYARMRELSKGKDTTTGHWEMMGIISDKPFPTYPNGFPEDVISEFEQKTGRKVLCNKTYSGTEVIKDYGEEHIKTGNLIVYTSADSVFQIAAHEDIVSVEKLYEYCEIAREMLKDEHGVGRVIARPFTGKYPFTRTKNRHDFSLEPTQKTTLNRISEKDLTCYGVGKINDIFAGAGLNGYIRTADNADGMKKTAEFAQKEWTGFCFVNLVDFDSSYGHRNDVAGYTNALNEFDVWLGEFLQQMNSDDVLMITADHGCDPTTASTDHSREYTPLIIYGKEIEPENLGTIDGFDYIGRMVEGYLGL